jgi:hypothetical protein
MWHYSIQLYDWLIKCCAMPGHNIATVCHSLSLSLQRHLLLHHDFQALFALSHLPVKISILCKSGQVLFPSALITCHTSGLQLPVSVNLCWLFVVYDLLSFSGRLTVAINDVQRKYVNCQLFKHILVCHQNPKVSVQSIDKSIARPLGGSRSYVFPSSAVLPFLQKNYDNLDCESVFHFLDHVENTDLEAFPIEQLSVHTNIPLIDLTPHIPVKMVHKIAHIHNISIGSHVPKKKLVTSFKNHDCQNCKSFVTVFSATTS